MKQDLLAQFRQGLVDKSLKWPSRWATKKVWMPSPFEGLLDFGPFPWLEEIVNVMEGQVSVMKGSQLGCSVVAMVKSLFTAIEMRDEAMIVQPTAQAAGLFAQSRLDAIIATSPALRDAFPKNDSVSLKTTKFHSHIFMRGSISEAGLTSQPVSVAIIDEFDRCNINCLALIKKRMSARSLAQRHVFVLSTPILPEMGIDQQFREGTQERFVFDCPGCSRGITLEWPESVEIIGASPDDPRCAESYFKCQHCGHKLDIDERALDPKYKNEFLMKPWLSTARWEANAEAQYHRSFYIPQMYGPKITAGEMVVESIKAEANEAEKVQFVNQSLGLPYVMEGAKLSNEIINRCIGDHHLTDDPPVEGGRMIVMGIDVGTMLDCVVTEYIYTRDPGFEPHLASVAKVLQVRRIPGGDWGQLGNLMRDYSIEHAVIDFQPETTMARAFANEFYGGVSLCQYRKGTQQLDINCKVGDDKVSLLTVDRTSFLDMALGRFHKQQVIIPVDTGYVFKEHLCNLTRTYEYDENNRPKAKYVTPPNKADHLAHAYTLGEVAHMRAYAKRSGRSIGNDDSIRDF